MSTCPTSPPKARQPTNPTNAAQPTRQIFDPWNSSSTGYQRAENRLSSSTSWRDSRTLKLSAQFADGQNGGGGKRVADTAGAGSANFGRDGRKENSGWQMGAKGLRKGGQRSLWECRGVGGGKKTGMGLEVRKDDGKDRGENSVAGNAEEEEARFVPDDALYQLTTKATPYQTQSASSEPPAHTNTNSKRATSDWSQNDSDPDNLGEEDTSTPSSTQLFPMPSHQPPAPTSATTSHNPPHIFRNLTIYINGSTYPLISEHKLKRLLVQHGANLSITLGRRSVTHVILGAPNSRSDDRNARVGHSLTSPNRRSNDKSGAGGGLASSKLQKEIATSLSRGANVKYVGAGWVLESLKRGTRAPEWKFEVLRCAGERQRSVVGMFGKS